MLRMEQTNEIILKYSKVLPSCCCFMDCVKCAITEVEAIIEALDEIGYFGEDYRAILEHLKQM